jgi:hypothetical protein
LLQGPEKLEEKRDQDEFEDSGCMIAKKLRKLNKVNWDVLATLSPQLSVSETKFLETKCFAV